MFTVINTTTPIAETEYIARCWKCEVTFNAAAASWCACDKPLRTIVCPRCISCFCIAPLAYKARFWNGAPRAMREHRNRFRVSHHAAPAAKQDAVTASASLPPRVLVVDDEEPMRSLVACYVEQLGYRVTTATNGEEALTVLDCLDFDVVLTDALMPKMDGRELSRIVKKQHGDSIKVILMTSLYKARRFQTEARDQFGVDEYLTKPIAISDLRSALERAVAKAVSPRPAAPNVSEMRTLSRFQTPAIHPESR